MARPPDELPLRDGKVRWTAEALHLTALGIWTGVAAMSGGVAAVVFPATRELAPSLPDFAAFPEARHADLAAGWIQNRVFLLADAVQFVAAFIALATLLVLIAWARLPLRRISSAVRVLAVGMSLGLLSYSLMILGPRMQTSLSDYWEQARAGNIQAADAHYAAFEADHPKASNALMGTTLSTIVALVSGAFSAASLGGMQRPTPRGSPIEPPALAQRRGRDR
jgi:hypothetical protein